MVVTVSSVDVLEDLASFCGLDTALEHAGHAALVELTVDDDEGFAAVHDHSRLCLFHGQDLVLEVGEEWHSLVARLPDHGDQSRLGL